MKINFKIILLTLMILVMGVSSGYPSKEITFTVLHTNDEHSNLIPHSPAIDYIPGAKSPKEDPTQGGFARLATLVEKIRQEKEEDVFLLNAGDYFGGSIFGWLAFHGYSPELKIMKKIGYDAAVIGNHEYDYGTEVLAEYLLETGYPRAHKSLTLLATNSRAPHGHPIKEKGLFKSQHILEESNGLKIGLLGILGESASSLIARSDKMEFLEPYQAAGEEIKKLREKGADVIVALTHSGIEDDRKLAQKVPEIDLIIGSHCHTPLKEPVYKDNTPIVQAGYYLSHLGYLELSYNLKTEQLKILNKSSNSPYLIPIDANVSPHPVISKMVNFYKKKLGEIIYELTGGEYQRALDTVIRSDFKLPKEPLTEESTAGNFITDAMRIVGSEISKTRADLSLQVNANIRDDFIPGRDGDITFYNMTGVTGLGRGEELYPGYPLVSVYFTGKEIGYILESSVLMKELLGGDYFLQFSGISYDYNSSDAVLFKVPFLDIPVPTTRAVKKAKLYTGRGVQPSRSESDEYVPLKKNNKKLYNLITDTYIISSLYMVGEMLPHVEIVPKDEQGNPIALKNIEQSSIFYKDRPLRAWEAAIKYATRQNKDSEGIPVMPEYYRAPSGRINSIEGWAYNSYLLGIIVFVILVLLLKKISFKKVNR